MQLGTLKLLIPLLAITTQHTAVSFVSPPFLKGLDFHISLIGSLISLNPVFALLARLPSGLLYRGPRARLLLAATFLATSAGNLLYPYSQTPLHFALIHGLNGFLFGAATTIYLAYFVEALPPNEDRHHAMGYYAGALSLGFAIGGLLAGYVADLFDYASAFRFAALLPFLGLIALIFLKAPAATPPAARQRTAEQKVRFRDALHLILHPSVGAIVVIALFLNMLHQLGAVFLPLYGLAVGLSLTQLGLIRGLYAFCNAVTRPISGHLVKRTGHHLPARLGLPIQAALIMLTPLFHEFGPLLAVFIAAGFVRAVALVGNTIGMVQDIDHGRVGRGMVSGIFHASGDIGSILGPAVGGFIASFSGIGGLFFAGPLFIAAGFSLSLWACKLLGKNRLPLT